MLKKSCAIILSIALAMGILVHGSFAFGSWGEEMSWISASGVSAMSIEIIEDAISSNDFQYMAVFHRDGVSLNDASVVILSDGELMNRTTSGFGLVSYYQDLTIKIFTIKSDGSIYNVENITEPYSHRTSGGVDYYYYKNSTDVWYLQSGGVGYATYNFTQFSSYPPSSGTTYPANLTGAPWQDNRILNVDRVLYNGVQYVGLYTDDDYSTDTWVSFRFTDQFGNGTTIVDYDDMIFTQKYDLNLWLINPARISSYDFTLNSLLYSGSVEWGYDEITNIGLRFGDSPLPSPVPDDPEIIPDYNYQQTNIINYNGGEKDVYYNSFAIVLKLYGDVPGIPSYFVDSDHYLEQPFAYNFILLPEYLSTQDFLYDDFLNDCFYQYDVIFSEYYDSFFDYWYGSGALASLQAALVGWTAGQNISEVLDTWYSQHNPSLYTFPYQGGEDLVYLGYDDSTLMVVTDSFYFKQTNYLLGDSGDILSQFSERFYKVGGFSDSLFQNMAAIYNLEYAFYDSALPALTNLSYFVNGLSVNENFDSVIQLLSSVDNYLSSVDGKLSNIDSDIVDLLEWFQNQEDSDVTLTLPDFNPSILINIYGENIGDFVEFVQGFVNTLPEFDFSDFPNFFDYAADLVDDTAGSGDDLIGSLFNPYDYDDSGLHEFGWD